MSYDIYSTQVNNHHEASKTAKKAAYHFNTRIDTLHHVWSIENYTHRFETRETLETFIFTSDTNDKFKWYLSLETDMRIADCRTLYLNLDSSSKRQKVFAKYKFCILDNNQREMWIRRSDPGDESIGRGLDTCSFGWGCKRFITAEIFHHRKLLPNDKLTIRCQVTFETLENSLQSENGASKRCIFSDNRLLFENKEFADFTLSVRNGKSYKAHKAILAARSPVFAAMFEYNVIENQNNNVDIIDIDDQIIEEMLRYIYTDRCENLTDLAEGLLIAAEKYALVGLKIMCQKVLIGKLSVENAIDLLMLAHMYGAAELKVKVLNIIEIDDQIIEKMLRYIYTDKCENLTDLAESLLIAADKYYKMEFQKVMKCNRVSVWRKKLYVKNTTDLLMLAHVYGAELKIKVMNLIFFNAYEDKTPTYLTLLFREWRARVAFYRRSSAALICIFLFLCVVMLVLLTIVES